MKSFSQLIEKITGASNILPALRLVWQAAPVWSSLQAILLLVQGIVPLAQLYLTKLIIDTITENLGQPGYGENAQRLFFLLLLLAITLLLTTFVNTISNLVNTAQSQRFIDYMSQILHAQSIAIDLEFYENSEYHDTLQRAQQEATYRPNQLLKDLISLIQNTVSLVVMGGLLVTLHWAVAVAILLAAVPTLWVRMRYADVRYQWQRYRTSLERQSTYLTWLMVHDSFAKEVRLFSLGNLFSQRFNLLRKRLYREMLAITRRFTWSTLLAQGLSTIVIVVAYGYIIYRTFQGQLSIGDMVLYYEALQRAQQAFGGLMTSLSALYEDNLFLKNLYDFLNLEPKIKSPTHPKLMPNPMHQGICVENLNFKYSGTERQALHDISLHIRPGEVIALVGENGSGKTTLVKLLCRLYDPTAGRITIDGVNLKDFDVVDLRRQISVVFQDYVQYHMTAQENIWLGNIDLPPDSDLIAKAAFKSGANAVIERLPKQYDTMLGKWFEEGEELSIGQWQKVALARAFLRNSQLVILDEPTSAMDPKAEFEVFQAFRQLIRGQSAILISHRLSTVKMADRIYLMDKGRIVESGSHAELIQSQGQYAKLFEIQAHSYR